MLFNNITYVKSEEIKCGKDFTMTESKKGVTYNRNISELEGIVKI